MIKYLLAFLVSFAFSLGLMPFIIKFIKRKKASQTILGYVENHKEKNGTPTMGGVVFLIDTLVLSFFFLDYDHTWFICLLVSLFFGVLGFLDDFIKIKFAMQRTNNNDSFAILRHAIICTIKNSPRYRIAQILQLIKNSL